jgi:hypothetical protein
MQHLYTTIVLRLPRPPLWSRFHKPTIRLPQATTPHLNFNRRNAALIIKPPKHQRVGFALSPAATGDHA